MKKYIFLICCLSLLPGASFAGFEYDFGADLRMRQEILDNVPGLPGGGIDFNGVRKNYTNHMRFRPRVWGEMKFGADNNWRIYTRVTDEMRWYVRPKKTTYTWPGELVLDNFFVEGKSLFDGFLDIGFGRQDIYHLYGLDHIFVDGTPGDGSRTLYSNIARATFNFTDETKLDAFFLYNRDDNPLRIGTDRSNHISMTGLGGGAEPEMDDLGFGAIFSSCVGKDIPYQIFAMQKRTRAYHRAGVKHPGARRSLLGMKFMPQLTETISLQLEAMGQVGKNRTDDHLTGWSTYSAIAWKSSNDGFKPFAKLGFHIMSGDKNAGEEEGGYNAWDPMWSRAVNDSEMFLYGVHYGRAWWSNIVFLKSTLGLDFGGNHSLTYCCGPFFAHKRDGLGGGNGNFKGFLNQLKYTVPFLVPEKSIGERFEIFGHLVGEYFLPGDYFESERAAWMVRWQVDFRF